MSKVISAVRVRSFGTQFIAIWRQKKKCEKKIEEKNTLDVIVRACCMSFLCVSNVMCIVGGFEWSNCWFVY